MRPMVKNCYSVYDIHQQDEQPYGVGWIPFEGNTRRNNSSPEFAYTSQKDLDGMPYMGEVTWYSGGGYVFLLRGTEDAMQRNFNELDQEHWMDFSTRGILIQFAIFNPNINLFAIVTALIEKPGTGALITSYRIETANLFGSAATEAGRLEMAFQVSCEILPNVVLLFSSEIYETIVIMIDTYSSCPKIGLIFEFSYCQPNNLDT